MTVNYKGDKEPGRNELCECGSRLKFKFCHGDLGKRAACERVLAEHMMKLIVREQLKRKIITQEQHDTFFAKFNNLPEPVNEHDVGEILDKANLKRCAGALCSQPIPDTQEFCIGCQSKIKEA
jgi:hypothetical protein